MTADGASLDSAAGSRHWADLSSAEQDSVLLASVDMNLLGDVVARVGEYPMVATSIGTTMMLAYGTPSAAEATMPPSHPARHASMLLRAARRLQGSALGDRLVSALSRAPAYTADALAPFADVDDAEGVLRFTPLDPAANAVGMDTLDPQCFGGYDRLLTAPTVQVRGKYVPVAEAQKMIATANESRAWLDGAVHASRLLQGQQPLRVSTPQPSSGLPLRARRQAHFVGAVAAAAAFVGFLFSSINTYGGIADGFPIAVLAGGISYPIGWGLTRLWAWYRNTPLT